MTLHAFWKMNKRYKNQSAPTLNNIHCQYFSNSIHLYAITAHYSSLTVWYQLRKSVNKHILFLKACKFILRQSEHFLLLLVSLKINVVSSPESQLLLLFSSQMRGLAKEHLVDIVAKFEPCPENLQRMVLGIDGRVNAHKWSISHNSCVARTDVTKTFILQVLQTTCGVLQVTSSTLSTTRWTRTWRSLCVTTSLLHHTTPTWQETSCCLSLEWKCTPMFSRPAVAVWRVRACKGL